MHGATDTDFFHKANLQETINYKEKKLLSPKDVAKDSCEALMSGDPRIISGVNAKQHLWMSNMMPDSASASNTRKPMETSNKVNEEGRTESGHEPSKSERETIKQEKGKGVGDYSKEPITRNK